MGGVASGAALAGQFYVVVRGSPNRAYAYNRMTNQWKARAAPQFFGSMTLVRLDGRPRLVTGIGSHTLMYTP